MFQISNKGLLLIQNFEEFRSLPYLDIGRVPTIGYGTTIYPNGTKVTLHDNGITEEKAVDYMQYDLSAVQEWLNNVIYEYDLTFNQNQFDAMCSFFYNIGYGSFKQKNPNTWQSLITNNLSQFAKNMLLFNKVRINGRLQICDGLTNRRNAEVKLFNS